MWLPGRRRLSLCQRAKPRDAMSIANYRTQYRRSRKWCAALGAGDALAERFGVRVLSLDDEIVRRWGRISGEAKRASGHPPPVIDALVAASATEHDLYLVTRSAKDTEPTGVTVFNRWNDHAQNVSLEPAHRTAPIAK